MTHCLFVEPWIVCGRSKASNSACATFISSSFCWKASRASAGTRPRGRAKSAGTAARHQHRNRQPAPPRNPNLLHNSKDLTTHNREKRGVQPRHDKEYSPGRDRLRNQRGSPRQQRGAEQELPGFDIPRRGGSRLDVPRLRRQVSLFRSNHKQDHAVQRERNRNRPLSGNISACLNRAANAMARSIRRLVRMAPHPHGSKAAPRHPSDSRSRNAPCRRPTPPATESSRSLSRGSRRYHTLPFSACRPEPWDARRQGDNYNTRFSLGLTEQEKSDLLEYLKPL